MTRDTGADALQRQLTAEGAANLGRLGRAVEASLARLREETNRERRDALCYESAHAVWQYFVQREACGLVRHDAVIETYDIPREVLAKVGASPR